MDKHLLRWSKKGEFKIAVSELLFQELERAPEYVKKFLDSLPEEQILSAVYNDDAKNLADQYLKAEIVGPTSLTDCRHIATATINNIRILTSWNFKHIVNLSKIQLSLKGFYCTLQVPLHPVVKVFLAGISYYGFSIGFGYQFSSN